MSTRDGSDGEITVSWTATQLMELRPDWSRQRCEAFLQRHTEPFAAGMTRMGLQVLAEMSADPRYGGEAPPKPPSDDGVRKFSK